MRIRGQGRTLRTAAPLLFAFFVFMGAVHSTPVDFASLLSEMYDLETLARLPDPPYRTVQFSSFDRRSLSPEAPDWYANTDGFGGEPVPGFEAVLEEPKEGGEGLYLVADVQGPGAIVRGWSAGMGGVLEVRLDGSESPLYQGTAYDFLARRSRIWFEEAGLELGAGDAFCQEDADYLPVPFEKSLRVTWRGNLSELHFYHLEVRLYGKDVSVKTFDPARDLPAFREAIELARERLTRPAGHLEAEPIQETADLEPGDTFSWKTPDPGGAGVLEEIRLRLLSEDLVQSLRGCLLRIAFDGAQKPQVEAPLGDFFGSGPGLDPFESLPMSAGADGTLSCRFLMPFREKAELLILNATDRKVRIEASIRAGAWNWDERSLYFRAKWRTLNRIDLAFGPFDVPYVVLQGQGAFVGAACMLVNPSAVPHPYGSWWGEGDEKIFVDGEARPSFFGTGSEDYFNYSWSRPDLFAHPYCGQPLDTGPGNMGYCSDYRFHIIDAIPFDRSFAFYMEAYPHDARPGLCYGCIAYLYTRPGAIDDHRGLMKNDLVVMPVPSVEPEPTFGAHAAIFLQFQDLPIEEKGGALGFEADWPTASRGRLLAWDAHEGDRLAFPFDWEKEGFFAVNLVAAHQPYGGVVRVLLDGEALNVEDLGGAALGATGGERLVLKSPHARRLLSTRFQPAALSPGSHALSVECLEAGKFAFDYAWIQPAQPPR